MYMLKRFTAAFPFAVFTAIVLLFASCEEEVDDLPSQTVPTDGGYFDVTDITVSNIRDINGNGYYPVGDVSGNVQVNANAPDGYSKTVYVNLAIKLTSSSRTVLAKSSNFTLSKGGSANTVTFQGVNFADVISEQGDYNLTFDIHDASDNRRIVSQGFLGQHETIRQDSTITYELQDVVWDEGTDVNGDGYYTRRSFRTSVVSLGESGSVANVSYWLQRGYFDENQELQFEVVPLGNQPNYEIERKGFGDVIEGQIDSDALGITRAQYSLGILAIEVGTTDTLINQLVTRDAVKDLAFENTTYEARVYSVNSVTFDSLIDMDGDGFYRSVDFSFTVDGPAGLDYDTIPGTLSPVALLWYAGPATGGELELYSFKAATPGTPDEMVRFTVNNLDSGLYNFEISINENPANVTVPTPDEGQELVRYDQADFPELGMVPIERNSGDQ